MNKSGYSIIFFVGYLLGVTCLVALGFEWLISLNKSYRSFTKKHRITVRAKLALDSLTRDIHAAPKQQELWSNQGPDMLEWKTEAGERIAWEVCNKELIRSQTKIEKKAKKIQNSSKSVLLNQVSYFRGVTVKGLDGTIAGIVLSYSIGPVELRDCFIRTGVNA